MFNCLLFVLCRKLDRERQDQYQSQLNEIQKRVLSRPLLLEQAPLSERSVASLKKTEQQ